MENDMQVTVVRAVVVMVALMVLAIVGLEIFHPGDNAIAIGHILTIGVPTTLGLMTYLNSVQNGRKSDAISTAVNGLNAERVADARSAGHAAGVTAERARAGQCDEKTPE
jgi:hypothetical protein